VILITTLDAALLGSVAIAFSAIVGPAGIALAPASDGTASTHVYVSARGVDNTVDPNENDGRMFEFALSWALGGRRRPGSIDRHRTLTRGCTSRHLPLPTVSASEPLLVMGIPPGSTEPKGPT
jgi:hypothetical protein